MIVAYYRVSTQKQGHSGLGLEAQRQTVESWVKGRGQGHLKDTSELVIAEYVEVETGKKSDRPELQKALQHAKQVGATLVVAKLDRLARNLHFLTSLMEAKVEFVACDAPHANKFTLQIMGAVAEHEAELISQRTKVALKAAKERGTLLGAARPGYWAGRSGAEFSKAGVESRKRAIEDVRRTVIEQIKPFAGKGKTCQQIADDLNSAGICSISGGRWNRWSVHRLVK